jgi:sporulation protein YlmC with PRC-barrel domain
MRHLLLRAIVLVIAFSAAPALPQAKDRDSNPPSAGQKHAANPSPNDTSAPPGGKSEIGTATVKPTGIPPSERNPLLTDDGAVRISKLVGQTVFNKDDKKIGSVDDVVAGQNGQLQVVIATDSKKVAVPWNKLVFGDAKINNDNTVLIPDETPEGLNKRPEFAYQHQNKKS